MSKGLTNLDLSSTYTYGYLEKNGSFAFRPVTDSGAMKQKLPVLQQSNGKKLEAWSGAPVNNIVENMKHE